MPISQHSNFFEAAFYYASIGKALVSPEGQWLKVNQSLCDLLKYSEAELMAIDFQTVTHPEDLQTDLNLAKELLEGKRDNYRMEKRYITKTGEIIWCLLTVALIRDTARTPRFFVSQVQDITELKEMQKKLSEQSRLESLWRMSVSIAHEINNPLTIVTLNAQTIQKILASESPDLAIIDKFSDGITKASKRIAHSIEKLRQHSRPESIPGNLDDREIEILLQDLLKQQD